MVATFLQKLVKLETVIYQKKKHVTFQKLKIILLIIFDFYSSILDRFLSAQPIDKDIFQLSGCAAFLLAAKHEERDPPKITELVNLCAHCYMKVSCFFIRLFYLNISNRSSKKGGNFFLLSLNLMKGLIHFF